MIGSMWHRKPTFINDQDQPYAPTVGSFIVRNIHFTCREQLFNNIKALIVSNLNFDIGIFCRNQHNANLTARCISKIEKMLWIKRKSKFFITIFKDRKICILHVLPSYFWKRRTSRLSLFTLLLRRARKYNGKNFDRIIYHSHYLEDDYEYRKPCLAYSIRKFFDGYDLDRECGGESGWVDKIYCCHGKGMKNKVNSIMKKRR